MIEIVVAGELGLILGLSVVIKLLLDKTAWLESKMWRHNEILTEIINDHIAEFSDKKEAAR